MTILLWVVAALLVLTGIAGTLLPMLPGVPLVFAGLLLAAWADGFRAVGWPVLAILAALTLASLIVEAVASSIGAKRAGATRLAVLGAAIGAGVGMFFGLPGLLLGPFVGAAAGQLLGRGDLVEAGRVGAAAWVGFAVGALAKLGLALMMIVVFAIAWVT